MTTIPKMNNQVLRKIFDAHNEDLKEKTKSWSNVLCTADVRMELPFFQTN